jgi:hypothetical protein
MRRRRVAFNTASSSKGKAKQDTSSEDECFSFDDEDDEKMALFMEVWQIHGEEGLSCKKEEIII